MNVPNLDREAAKCAQEMVNKARNGEVTQKKVEGEKDNENTLKPVETLERLVTKTLGVLQEQGVYAVMLFLFSRTSDEDKIAPIVRKSFIQLLAVVPELKGSIDRLDGGAKAQPTLKFFSDNILNNLDKTLLVRDLYEQTLIYARYGAKAAVNELKKKKEEEANAAKTSEASS